jgi:ADP-ribose pyrophosphatase YjhB (NUDIX family)
MAEKKAYKNPTPPVDCIIELSGERIVLIRRANPPVGWATEAKAFPVDALPKELCFDHGTILADYRAYKRTGQRRKL